MERQSSEDIQFSDAERASYERLKGNSLSKEDKTSDGVGFISEKTSNILHGLYNFYENRTAFIYARDRGVKDLSFSRAVSIGENYLKDIHELNGRETELFNQIYIAITEKPIPQAHLAYYRNGFVAGLGVVLKAFETEFGEGISQRLKAVNERDLREAFRNDKDKLTLEASYSVIDRIKFQKDIPDYQVSLDKIITNLAEEAPQAAGLGVWDGAERMYRAIDYLWDKGLSSRHDAKIAPHDNQSY